MAHEFDMNGGWWEFADGWRIECSAADFPPCGRKYDGIHNWSCMAQPGHEHPCVTAETYHPFWFSNRITRVSRKSSVKIKA